MMIIKINGQTFQMVVSRYLYPENIRIQLTTLDGEPVAQLTANPSTLLPDDMFVVRNYAENEGLLEDLILHGIIEDTGYEAPVGLRMLPICKFPVQENDETGEEPDA